MGAEPFLRHYPRRAEIERAVEAGKACGLDVAGYEVSPDGSIRVFEARAMPKHKPTAFDLYEADL